MKVIGVGFGRTGTMSLKHGLEMIGFAPCYHMVEVIQNKSHIPLWQEATEAVAQGEVVDWSKIFEGYEAAVDYPTASYYKELVAAYPEAKVVLTVRDPERWYDSTLETIYQLGHMPWRVEAFVPGFKQMQTMVQAAVWQKVFNGRFTDKPYAIACFEEHIDQVKAFVSPQKLLIFSVKDGWEPLCNFLEVPIPDEPFPHVNDRAEMEKNIRTIQVVALVPPILLLTLLLSVVWYLRWKLSQ